MKSLLNRPTLKNVVLPILIDLKYISDGGAILAGTASSIDGDASGRYGVRSYCVRRRRNERNVINEFHTKNVKINLKNFKLYGQL